jgi:acetyl esterase/lipase
MAKEAPIKRAKFVQGWMDMDPKIPVPRIDWIREKSLDIPYGDDEAQRYDLYYPNERSGVLPLVVIVHGGGFSHMDKRDWHLYPGFYALREGFAVASINYRLAPKHPYPAGVLDMKAAIRHIRENSKRFGIDEKNIFLQGTSAGGSLVSIAGLDGEKDETCRVQGVAALCPVINCSLILEESIKLKPYLIMRFVVSMMMREYIKGPDKKRQMVEASADSHIGETIPAFYIQVGDRDPLITVNQCESFYKALKAVDPTPGKVALDIMEGAAHAGGGPDYMEEKNIMRVLEFFKSHMAERE